MAGTSVTPRPLGLQGRWRTYTPADGLAGLYVEHIVEDQEGCLWFATASGGVSRYDGDTFQTYTVHDGLVSDQVFALLCDRRGRLWIGTLDRGLCWYEGEAFQRFGPEAWCSRGGAEFLFEDSRGRVWCAGGAGVGWWDGEELHDLSTAYVQACGRRFGMCWGIAEDSAGGVWFGGEELVRWDGSSFRNYGAESGLEGMGPSGISVGHDGHRALWVGRGQRLWRWDGALLVPVAAPLAAVVRKLQTDRSGRLWVCTNGGGVLVHDGGTFHALGPEDGLAQASISGVCQDREGQVWFAAWGGGVSCLDPQGCHAPEPIRSAAGDRAWSLVADRHGVRWAGTHEGPVCAGPAATVYLGVWQDGRQVLEDLGLQTVFWHRPVVAADGADGLWLGTQQGLRHLRGEAWEKVFPPGEGTPRPVAALTADAAGRLLFACGTQDGQWQIVRCHRRQFEVLFTGFEGAHVTALLVGNDGSVWVGFGALRAQGSGDGLARLTPDGRLQHWRVAEGLVDDRVTDLAESQAGVLWIATLGGLSRLDRSGFRNFSRADGLPTHHVLCLCWDRRGRLWMGTDGALVVYDDRTFQYQWLPEVASIHDLAEDPAGALWLATAKGIRRYVPQTYRPGVRVRGVVADQVRENATEVHLSASVPQLQFDYQGMSLRTPAAEMVHRYRLQGYDADWQAPTRSRQARYPQLPVGEYVFEVEAADRDLNYSKPARVRLVVTPDPRLEGLTRALVTGGGGEFVGDSAAMRRVLVQLHEVAPGDTTVLILGETGTGKGLAARTLHQLSPRRGEPFITVSCGAVPEALVESELFGHERGAFTGAHRRQLGKVELAGAGTLLLDEIGDLPLPAQVKLLRLLEEGTFSRVGGSEELPCQARIIAATNRDLAAMVAAGTFREDLFFRLEVFVLRLPPLRERREDIELLGLYFLRKTTAHLHKPQVTGLAPESLAQLRGHAWPGNVRELEHVVRRAVIVAAGPNLQPEELGLQTGEMAPATAPAAQAPEGDGAAPITTLAENERRYIERALAHTGGVIRGPAGAARLLGIPASTLYDRMRRLQIRRSGSDTAAPV